MATPTLRETYLTELVRTVAHLQPHMTAEEMIALAQDINAGKIMSSNNTIHDIVRKLKDWFDPDNLLSVEDRIGQNNTANGVKVRLKAYRLAKKTLQDWLVLIHEDNRTIEQTEDMIRDFLAAATSP